MTDSPPARAVSNPCRTPYWLAAAVPVALFGALLLLYLVHPQLYLGYVLEASKREHQAVEFLTWTSALAASLMLGYAALRLWRQLPAPPAHPRGGLLSHPLHLWRERSGVLVIALIALASFFFAGEEVSWGQTYLRWATPERYYQYSVETNLHNVRISWLPSVQGLGSAFIVTMLVLLPLAWRKREKLGLPACLEPAVAEWPVAFSVLVAFAVKQIKDVYRLMHEDPESSVFYVNYLEQLNEQKEMLVGVSLLLYALFRLCRVRQTRQP